MFFKQLDFLSPKITLYHKGLLYHTSIISISLSILVIWEIFLISILKVKKIFNKNSQIPKMSTFINFIEDAGSFSINSSSFFHYISIKKDKYNQIEQEFDFEFFRIIGLDKNLDEYLDDKDLYKFDHWLYGPCNNDSYTIELNNLINKEYFNKSACIIKFYDSKNKIYYNTNELKH